MHLKLVILVLALAFANVHSDPFLEYLAYLKPFFQGFTGNADSSQEEAAPSGLLSLIALMKPAMEVFKGLQEKAAPREGSNTGTHEQQKATSYPELKKDLVDTLKQIQSRLLIIKAAKEGAQKRD